MDQTVDDSSSLGGESSTGAGSVCYMALAAFFNGKGPGWNRTQASF